MDGWMRGRGGLVEEGEGWIRRGKDDQGKEKEEKWTRGTQSEEAGMRE